MYIVLSYFPFGFEGKMWDLIVSVPDHCLSFYFTSRVGSEIGAWTLCYGYTCSEQVSYLTYYASNAYFLAI